MGIKIERFEQLLEHLSAYIVTRLELFKLDAEEKLAITLAKMAQVFALLFLLAFMVIFIGFGLAVLINNWLESPYWGFFIVGGIALLKVFLLLAFNRTKSGKLLFQRMITVLISNVEDND